MIFFCLTKVIRQAKKHNFYGMVNRIWRDTISVYRILEIIFCFELVFLISNENFYLKGNNNDMGGKGHTILACKII